MKKLCVLLLLTVSLFANAKEYTFSPKDVPAMKQLLGSGNLQPGDYLACALYRLYCCSEYGCAGLLNE